MTSILLLASHPAGSRNTPLVASCYGNRNISTGLMGHLARMQSLKCRVQTIVYHSLRGNSTLHSAVKVIISAVTLYINYQA